jgi:hypothetical protein
VAHTASQSSESYLLQVMYLGARSLWLVAYLLIAFGANVDARGPTKAISLFVEA